MNEMELQRRRRRIVRGAQIALALVAGFVVAPVIFVAIKGAVGIAIAGALGIGVVNLAPVAGDKLANWRLRALKAEAGKNPIETLQRDYQQRQESLLHFRNAINAFSAAVQDFESKMDGFKAQFPKDAPKFEAQLVTMHKLLDVRRYRYREAKEALAEYESEITRADAIWKMGQEAAKMNAAAGMSDEDFVQKIKVETALDAVTNSMNTAFAELETSLIDEQGDDARGRKFLLEADAGPAATALKSIEEAKVPR